MGDVFRVGVAHGAWRVAHGTWHVAHSAKGRVPRSFPVASAQFSVALRLIRVGRTSYFVPRGRLARLPWWPAAGASDQCFVSSD